MANTPDLASCLTSDAGRSELLPLSPFQALRYHFGMLLGVDDFETEQGYHRAKLRMHNAWLHREGVVWGFDVKLDQQRGEIHVLPGLALDAAGHELHLEADACLNVGDWFDKHENDPDFAIEDIDGAKKFSAHVVIRFKACLTRQVPALLEPCDGAGAGAAYSRVFETVEILLLPNLAPARVYPYHRLRLMFGLDQPSEKEDSGEITDEDQAVLDEINNIQALPSGEQIAARLQAFHRFAALDEIDLKQATSEDGARLLFFPGRDDDPVVLADVRDITLTKQNDRWTVEGGNVDVSVRPSHIATTTIQDLLCGMRANEQSAGAGGIGPRVDRQSFTLDADHITFTFDKPLQASSVTADAFYVSVFDATSGWKGFAVTPTLDDQLQTVTLTPDAPPLDLGLVRVIARGGGPAPILGQDNLPIAGATNDAPAPQGADFIMMRLFLAE